MKTTLVNGVGATFTPAAARTSASVFNQVETLWIDTANFSGVHQQTFRVNAKGEIENEGFFWNYRFYRTTIKDKLSGDHGCCATWHRTKGAAVKAQLARIATERERLEMAYSAVAA